MGAYKKWGALASCSYGPWQIMYIVANEQGFKGHPMELWNSDVCLPYVIRLINRLAEKAPDLPNILAGYNTGSVKNTEKAANYIQKFYHYYNQLMNGVKIV